MFHLASRSPLGLVPSAKAFTSGQSNPAAMKQLDRILQRWRFQQALPFIVPGDRVFDVGCHQGELFEYLGGRLEFGLGVDPLLPTATHGPRYRLVSRDFPGSEADTGEGDFDVITMLAVLEHVPVAQHARLAESCARLLRPGGRLILTVPSGLVDRIIPILISLRLVDGMSHEQHYGLDPASVPQIFGTYFRLALHRRFQLGLNNLFLLRRL